MKRLPFKGFLIRFLLCLLVLSAALYLLHESRENQAAVITPDKQLVDVRSKLSEINLRSNALATFADDDPAASQTLARVTTELSNTNIDLQKQSRSATLLIKEQREAIKSIESLQTAALKQYRTSYQVLGQVIEYDPETDLGLLDPNQNTELFTNRALAAKNGLVKANASTLTSAASGLAVSDQDGAPLVVTEATRTVLQAQANCFEQLAVQAQNKSPETLQTRQQCIDSYKATRRQAVINVMQSAFSQEYIERLESLVTPLLKDLATKLDK